MREHAIPQDVVGYRFHIIGNMTLKQFLEVGAGCIVGLLIYNTNLYNVVRWPLIGFSVAIGAMAAFVPFEERPLDHWIVTFIKILYKPTKFFWRKDPKIPEAFTFTNKDASTLVNEMDFTPIRRQRIKDFIGTLDRQNSGDENDQAELQRINEIMGFFTSITPDQIQTARAVQRPQLRARTHSLKQIHIVEKSIGIPQQQLDQVTVYQDVMPQNYSYVKQQLDTSQVAQSISIPEIEEVSLKRTANNEESVNDSAPTLSQEGRVFSTATAVFEQPANAQAAAYNVDLPFPVKPTEPNKLVGMVLTPHNELISEAIVEIKTPDGQVARAVKTNALGQFFVTTPLNSGDYTLMVEKDGFSFPAQSLHLSGTIIDPIEIRSSSA